MSRDLYDEVPPERERRRWQRSRRTGRASREGIKFDGDFWWMLLCVSVVIGIAVIAFTDVWPYMHEVIWQQSWKPVCDYGHGHLEFCRP